MKDSENRKFLKKNRVTLQERSFPEKQTDIAIIGMACRFPGARNYEAFWQNLIKKQSNIQKIPRERWDWRDFWGDPKTEINKSNSKWGGFITDVNAFDTSFFDFSPREAEAMDPQQRIILELSWTCLEDAGIRPSMVSGKKVGVYIGVFNFDYKELQEKRICKIEAYHSTGTASALIANRISHYFNFKGPSFPINTACSGSLVAIHAAIQSLSLKECGMALAGGINLLLTPTRHISFSKTGLLSPTGSCKTFDEDADGYVRSEGAGLILLKPLKNAIIDGDSIHGIVKGSAVNHNGKTHTLTFPNADAQADVIFDAHQRANVPPESIRYIEAHGTGTPKGDPIEFQGLQKAFANLYSRKRVTVEKNRCGLGSVKTNIGHLEAAAGIAGVIKVLLCMKYRQLPGLLNFKKLNHRISIKDSPFYVVDQLQDWDPLVNENKQAFPRRAGISSFGYGGANAHVVLEEAPIINSRADKKLPYYLICLAAKIESSLRQKEEDLLLWLEGKGEKYNLIDLSMTLNLGRDHFKVRSALVVKNVRELREKLNQAHTNRESKGYFKASNAVKTKLIRPFFSELGRTISRKLCSDDIKSEMEYGHQLMALAELYVNGYNPDWKMIFHEYEMNRLHLPTYPFAKERYWISQDDTESNSLKAIKYRRPVFLHPLLHQNTSNLNEQRFSSTFTEKEFYLADHIVKGRKILPQVREAFELMTFEEVWKEQGLTDDALFEIKIMVCFLSDGRNQKEILKAIQSFEKPCDVVFISQGDSYQKRSKQAYRIARTGSNSYTEVFRSIREDYGKVDALLYMWAIEDSNCIQDYANIVHILQGLAANELKPKRLVLAAQFENDLERCYLESWLGFERSLKLVLSSTKALVIIQKAAKHSRDIVPVDWWPKILAELKTRKARSVLYQEGKRHVCQIRPTTLPSGRRIFRPHGTYLITGGFGGLGFLLAQHLAKNQSVNLILSGRSSMDAKKESKVKLLEKLGASVSYLQGDICDQKCFKEGLNQAKERFGKIHSVIHAAGIESNQSILEKDIQSFQKVLQPKIKGTLVLDNLLAKEPLDFICYFSSSAAILGDFGACDYAVGNRFQMAYAHYHNQQKLRGKALAINWPLWKDGGMRIGGDEIAEMYLKTSGQRFLESAEGLNLFDRIVSQENTQHLVLVGQRNRIHRFLGIVADLSTPAITKICGLSGQERQPDMKGLSVEECLERDLKDLAGSLLKIPQEKLDAKENLAKFGFDSISLAEFAVALTNHYGIEITPALFFGYFTLEKLTRYFLTAHLNSIQEFYRQEDTVEEAVLQRKPEALMAPKGRIKSRFTFKSAVRSDTEPIAVIGMSGRFPQARNIDKMWAILIQAQDTVQEIPFERFSGQSRWKCGRLQGVGEFDPRFFEISPKEAKSMDPRQRLLMQESWKALEDAGCGPNRIKTSNIGMFVGVEEGDYHLLGKANGTLISNHNAILAARLAYFLNLRGPVLAINTACSSGLVAAHQACQSLYADECDMALAAGVNLMLTPQIFEMLSQAGMLSKTGRCYAFDRRADGMVPGEAVAVVVLKRLSRAEADGDPIYAIIKASGINYDGKTNGITAPNGISQTELLKSIYSKYQVDPEEIEYIVTHGTGTKLGDPVEINALYEAFKDYTKKQRYCALTSTKTNFGHTFAASGLVSLISLIMALRHATIPASLHCEEENDYINWRKSPFYINKASKPWPRTSLKSRTGALSAFGMSGTNAHMVVQSYSKKEAKIFLEKYPYFLLALSAKTCEALEEKIEDMIAALKGGNWKKEDLLQISYTLLDGRRHFRQRCAIVVQDLDNAIYGLKKALGKEEVPNLFKGEVPRNFKGQKLMQAYAQELLNQSRTEPIDTNKYKEILYGLASLYCQGYDFAWKRLFHETNLRRINLPTYPFAKQSYWVSEKGASSDRAMTFSLADVLHPLLQQNRSDFSKQKFSSTFSGKEFFLADHVVKGNRVLPGVAYLEMARAGVAQSVGAFKDNHKSLRLKNVSWIRPIAVGEQAVEVNIGLVPKDNGNIVFEIDCDSDSDDPEPVVYCQGTAEFFSAVEIPSLDLNAIKTQCDQGILSSGQVYDVFRAMEIEYGPAHMGIEEIYVGQNQALAKLFLPSCTLDTQDRFVLHPSLLDAALQASISLIKEVKDMTLSSKTSSGSGRLQPILPFSLQELEILGKCSAKMWAAVRYSQCSTLKDRLQKLDIDLCDEQGKVCVSLKGFSSKALAGDVGKVDSSASIKTLMIRPVWKERPFNEKDQAPHYDKRLVILCEPHEITQKSIAARLKKVQCIILRSSRKDIAERFMAFAAQVFEAIQQILSKKISGQALIQIVVSNKAEQQLLRSLFGLLKTAHMENAKLLGQLIEIESGEELENLIEKLEENSRSPLDDQVRYQDGKRLVAARRVVEQPVESSKEEIKIPWKNNGVYLMTGGVGGLGLIFAEEIAQQTEGATLVLTGRSMLSEDKRDRLEQLKALGAHALYRQMDVTDEQALSDQLNYLQEEFGGLNGVIHAAGVIRDNYIVKKNKEEFLEVLAPKIKGLVNLDQASKTFNLDFMVLFSSLTGCLGNPGQSDYAIANAFMDAYAGYRNFLAASKKRCGQTLSIGWPLWKDGGMKVDEATKKMLMESTGMVAMQASTGVLALYRGLALGLDHVMVIEGNPSRIKQKLLAIHASTILPSDKDHRSSNSPTKSDRSTLMEKLQTALMQMVSNLLKVELKNIDAVAELNEYGFDSISFTEFANDLNQKYKLELTPVIFFEHPTISDLAEYLVEEHLQVFLPLLKKQKKVKIPKQVKEDNIEEKQTDAIKSSRFAETMAPSQARDAIITSEPIAIVGMSGTFPMARDLNEFWKNVVSGKNCITKIPKKRWDWRKYYGDPIREADKTKIKWGGFIDGADEFDPLFFRISPLDAELMDPQQRLLITYIWMAIEDSGIPLEKFSQNSTGVFIAAGPNNYVNLVDIPKNNPNAMPTIFPSIFPNRISHLLNLKGPSEYCETACSSTFYALHRAIRSIYYKECDQAIIGAVNLLLSPAGFIGLESMGFLSPTGQAKSFQQGADGYVRSEGAGAIIIKPLAKAIEDKDIIYAVIKGTGVSHGGKGMSLTSPNAKGMERAMIQAYQASGVDPRTVAYIEAHGIASPLADGIEINALNSAYQSLTTSNVDNPKEKAPCYLSTLKPFIGHGEIVSGLAAIIKVIFAIRHKLIPGIPRLSNLNENISLDQSPFKIIAENHPWKALSNYNGERLPRRASINSYGFGGVNTHVVLEEYLPEQEELRPAPLETTTQIVVLSAKNRERLGAVAQQMLEFIEYKKDFALPDLAYTLQVGRVAMQARLAMIVTDKKELSQGLKSYLKSIRAEEELETVIPTFIGNPSEASSTLKSLLFGPLEETFIKVILSEKDLEKIAFYWSRGGRIPWESLHREDGVRRIPLPTYPFKKNRCWLIQGEKQPSFKIDARRPRAKQSDNRPDVAGSDNLIKKKIGEILGIPPEQLPTRKALNRLGFTSLHMVNLRYLLARDFDAEIPMAVLGPNKTIAQLEQELSEIIKPKSDNKNKQIIPNMVDRFKPFALSDIQESYLAGRKLHLAGDRVGCHIYFEIKINDLDIYRLNKAWGYLLECHEMLRAVILPDGKQKILKKAPPYQIKTIDLRMKSDPERFAALKNIRNRMSHRVYEAGQWPLFDIRIGAVSESQSVIHFSIDELIIDAVGISMLLRQWQRIYENPAWKMLNLEISFRDYILAVEEFKATKLYRRDLTYWMEKLENLPQGPRLTSVPQFNQFNRNFYRKRLSGSLGKKQWVFLKKKAQDLNVSPTALLLSIFTEVLRMWSDNETFSIILTYFNRLPLHPHLKKVLGPFISTLIFVVKARKERSLEEIISDNQRRLWNSLDHSKVSGITVLRELKAKNKVSSSLYLPVVFTSLVNNLATEGDDGQESFFEKISFMVTQTPQVYLDHQVYEQQGGLKFSWDVAEEFFGKNVIRNLFSDYCNALKILSSEAEKWNFGTLTSELSGHKKIENNLVKSAANKTGDIKTLMKTDQGLPAGMKVESLPADRLQPFPLTDQQQAYLFGRSGHLSGSNYSCQLYQEAEAYNLDPKRLEQAWQKLIKTHAMLTTVIAQDGTQRILNKVPNYKIKVTHLTGKKGKEIQAELSTVKRRMLEHVFELDKWPYFDLRVSMINERLARIHFSMDMLIADANSIQLLWNQLLYFYENPNKAPQEIGVLFKDYVLGLQKYKKVNGYQKSIHHWERKFAEIPPGPLSSVTNFGKDNNNFSHTQFKGVLNDWNALKEAAKRLSVPPGMVLLTAYAEVFSAWLAGKSFSIVIPSWQRLPLDPQIDKVVGDFTTLSWVVSNGEKASFEEKVRLNHRTVTEDLAHMAVSGLKVLRKVVMKGGCNGVLRFPVVFTNLMTHSGAEFPKGFKKLEMISRTPQVFLDNISEECDQKLYYYWDVVLGIYPAGLIEEMFSGYARVLETLKADLKKWKQIDLKEVIKAQPEKYGDILLDTGGA
jgi:acyl transferase domain-containing protein/acyl carrier protein